MLGFIFSNPRRGENETYATKQELAELRQDTADVLRKTVDDANRVLELVESEVKDMLKRLDELELTCSNLSAVVETQAKTLTSLYDSISQAADILNDVRPPVLDQTPSTATEDATEPPEGDPEGMEDWEGPGQSFTVPQVPGYVYAGAVIDRTDVPVSHTGYLPEGQRWEVLRVEGNQVFYRTLD